MVARGAGLLPGACAALLCVHEAAWAQVDAGRPPAASPAVTAPTGGTARINVTSVQVEGNTLLPQQTLDALVAGAVGEGRTLSDLNAVAQRVQAAYRDAGYGGVVAFVPEQDASSGRVVIRVVEGKLAAVRIKGNVHFPEQNVRAALPSVREGQTPYVPAIDRDIQLSNENPAKEVRVTLAPGALPGQIDAEVSVSDARPLQLLAGFSNTGNHETGMGRLTVGVRHANFTGRDDVITALYQTSPEHPGRVRVGTLGYHLPVYEHGASLDVFYAHSNVANGTSSTPLGPLSFTGRGDLVSLRGNLNLERRSPVDQRVSLGIDWKDFDNECSVGTFGSVACGSAAVSVRAVPLSIGYTAQQQEGERAWGGSLGLAVNAGGSSASTFDAARPGARRHYVIGRLSAFTEFALDAGWGVSARFDAQYSPHALISAERFGVGGISSVRGYMERELTGDSGAVVRADLLMPSFDTRPTPDVRVRPIAFLDVGHVTSHKGLACRGLATTSCTAAGVGVGLRINFGTVVTASLDVARALRDGATNTERGDTRAHVSLTLVY